MEIPDLRGKQKRVVIVGAGFAGLSLAKKLSSEYFQVLLLDRNNYHQFQPLLYQVATAGLEPSSISFPIRKIFHNRRHVVIRHAEVLSVEPSLKKLRTNIGSVNYDYLVLANGASTNFFGMEDVKDHAYSMKSVSEALLIRNTMLQNYERALTCKSDEERDALLHVIIVGGGPTGVELAGAIAEMKNKILPRDYPEINFSMMKVCLVEASPRLLNGMSEPAGRKTLEYLHSLGVKVHASVSVKKYNGYEVHLSDGRIIKSRCMIWAAGVKAAPVHGIPPQYIRKDNRILVDAYNQAMDGIFAIGDIAAMHSESYPKGHPQVAPVAIQQAELLARNLKRMQMNKPLTAFRYRDKGSMATIGRNLAVVEIGRLRLKGFLAWLCWMFVHLMSIIGVKNRLLVFINWTWQYITYDQSLRLIIHPTEKKKKYENEKMAGADLVAGNALGLQQ